MKSTNLIAECCSAGDYVDAIQPVLCDIFRRNDKVIPTVVGGNTMWVDWLINGVCSSITLRSLIHRYQVPDAPGGTKIGKKEARLILKDYSERGW